MYLDYDEYTAMGGTLDSSAFQVYERKAEYLIKSQAAGQTGERIDSLPQIPEEVKNCMFDLIVFNAGIKEVQSESESQGDTSRSVSYAVKTADDIRMGQENIINQYLSTLLIGGVSALYRGASI